MKEILYICLIIFKINIIKKSLVKISLAAITLLGGFSLTSCDRVEEAVKSVEVPVPFDLPITIENKEIFYATIPTLDNFIDYPEISLNIDADKEIKNKYPALGIGNLRSVKLEGFKIELVDKTFSTTSLSAIKDAEIYLNAPNVEQKLVATITNNTNETIIDFQTKKEEELIEFFKSKENSIKIRFKSNQLTIDKIKVNITPVFKISVGL